jgi:choline dehydrogenase-like flavoprotein
MRPATRSSVHVSGQRPENPPVIDLHFLEDAADRAAAAAILGVAREVMAAGGLADLVAEEEFPGPGVTSRDDVLRYSAQTGTGIFHAVGSAAMGPADDDVTDPRLRVRGVDGLRIADASVLPMQVAGNSAAPVMAVGWIAADLILGDR